CNGEPPSAPTRPERQPERRHQVPAVLTVPVTPNRLADILGIDPKRLRQWLRDTHPRPDHLKWSPWQIAATPMKAAIHPFPGPCRARSVAEYDTAQRRLRSVHPPA